MNHKVIYLIEKYNINLVDLTKDVFNIAKHDIIRILVFIISPYGLSKLAADINVHLAFSGVRLGSKRNNSPVDVSSK